MAGARAGVRRLFMFGSATKNDEVLFRNGTKKAKKVLKQDVDWYDGQPDKVIAIDFGTSTLAVAWQNETGQVFDLPIQEYRTVPTFLLIKGNNRAEIGEKALVEYGNPETQSAAFVPIFFDKVKMELQHEKTINRNSTVVGSNGKNYYLIEIIIHILKKVRIRVEYYFRRRYNVDSLTDDFSWVLTVPALWGVRARAMMREAAYMAGLCDNAYCEYLKLPLKTAEEHHPPKLDDMQKNFHRLSLVFEPEAAAAYCMRMSDTDVKDKSNFTGSLATNGCFFTVDVGGGTIDITAHQVNDENVPVVFNLPCGRVFGGSLINESFIAFLEETTGATMTDYYCIGSNEITRKAEIQDIKSKLFEEAKRYFANDDIKENYYSVALPKLYCQWYGQVLERMGKKKHSFEFIKETNQLRLSEAKMMELARNCLHQIEECIKSAMDSVGMRPDIIYLVGGFGGSNLVVEHIRNVFEDIRIVIPQNPDLAIVRGACVYYKNKPIRTADATYGTVCKLRFDEKNKIHKEAEKVLGEGGSQYCTSLFKPFVQIGESIHPDHVYKSVYAPITADQKVLLLTLYSTREEYIDFAEKGEMGKEVCDGVTKLGCLFVDLSAMMDVPFSQRHVKLLVDFSSVEITITAFFSCNDIEIKLNTSTDFLSTIEKIENFQSI